MDVSDLTERMERQTRRIPLDMAKGQQYYTNWRTDCKLQAIRAQLHYICVHHIRICETGDAKTRRGSDTLKVLQNLIPDLIDWIISIGVCPVAAQLDESDPMRRIFVPDFDRVQVFRVIPPYGPARYEVEWRDLSPHAAGPGGLFGGLGGSEYAIEGRRAKRSLTDQRTDQRASGMPDDDDGSRSCIGVFVPYGTPQASDGSVNSCMSLSMAVVYGAHFYDNLHMRASIWASQPNGVVEDMVAPIAPTGLDNWMQVHTKDDTPLGKYGLGQKTQLYGGLYADLDVVSVRQFKTVMAMQENQEGVVSMESLGEHAWAAPSGKKYVAAPGVPGPGDLISTREYYLHQLCKFFGVPPSSVGLSSTDSGKGGGNVGGAGSASRGEDEAQWDRTCSYWCRIITDFVDFATHTLTALSGDGAADRKRAKLVDSVTVRVERKVDDGMLPWLQLLIQQGALTPKGMEQIGGVIMSQMGLSTEGNNEGERLVKASLAPTEPASAPSASDKSSAARK